MLTNFTRTRGRLDRLPALSLGPGVVAGPGAAGPCGGSWCMAGVVWWLKWESPNRVVGALDLNGVPAVTYSPTPSRV
ncbi:hypothetical protein ACFVWT_12660, partial [Arthrobacter sp. NPDC058288]|uniref:hypothetical protein n=1 Tax=Arthrobacter sp. NPDC058288 TaxID=3346424 RepID=UPI0036EB88D2